MPSPPRSLWLLLPLTLGLAACAETLEGDVEIEVAEDLAMLEGVAAVEGTLHLRRLDVEELSLTELREVGGLELFSNTSLEAVEMPRLDLIGEGGVAIGYNRPFTDCQAWELIAGIHEAEGLGGSVVIYGNADELAPCEFEFTLE